MSEVRKGGSGDSTDQERCEDKARKGLRMYFINVNFF